VPYDRIDPVESAKPAAVAPVHATLLSPVEREAERRRREQAREERKRRENRAPDAPRTPAPSPDSHPESGADRPHIDVRA
jgi:hypothetical protein